jgi:hypothetical protein
MDDTDRYFTHTIVGAPVTLVLGERATPPAQAAPVFSGVEVSARDGSRSLSAIWREDVVLRRPGDPWQAGTPRRWPGPGRRWVERHALWLGVSGWTAALAVAVTWVLTRFG